jgi:hypothetical protein
VVAALATALLVLLVVCDQLGVGYPAEPAPARERAG